jgi:hypothetical protein
MIHRLSRIIAHDEWVGPQRLAAVRTGVVQARHSREQAVMIVDDEHLGVLLHQSLSEYAVLLGSRLSGMSVVNGRMDGKRVCQFGLPNGVKDVMRRSLTSKRYTPCFALLSFNRYERSVLMRSPEPADVSFNNRYFGCDTVLTAPSIRDASEHTAG